MTTSASPPSRVATTVVAALTTVLVGSCSGSPETTSTSTPTATAASPVEMVELPDAAVPFLQLDDGEQVALVSRCATSTPARSTVIATADDGREIAVTVFVSADPTVEVDVVDLDGGGLLTTANLGSGRWAFRGASLVGSGSLSGAAGRSEVSFAIDFSADLPACDNQDELGPGNEEATPDVIRT